MFDNISNNWMLVIFLVYALLPVLIILRIPRTIERKVRWCRFRYAIPSILLTIVNIAGFVYWYRGGEISVFQENEYAYLVPALALLLSLIVFRAGKKAEKVIHTQLAGMEIENVRLKKDSTRRSQLVIGSEDDIENL